MTYFQQYVVLFGVNIMVFAETQNVRTDVKQSFRDMLRDIVHVNQGRMNTLRKLMTLEDIALARADLRYLNNDESDLSSDEDAKQSAIMTILDILHKKRGNRRAQPLNEEQEAVKIITHPKDKIAISNDEKILVDETSKDSVSGSKEDNLSKNDETNVNQEVEVVTEANKKHAKNVKMTDLKQLDSDLLRKNWIKTVKKKGEKTCIKACKAAHKNFCRLYSCSSRAKKTFKKECKLNCKAKFRGQYDSE